MVYRILTFGGADSRLKKHGLKPVSHALRRSVFVAMLVVAGTPAAALAEPSDNTATLTLNVAGTIPPRCMVAFDDTRATLDLARLSGSSDIPFGIDCNDRMVMRIKSRFGAMLHEAAPVIQPSPGFDQNQPYRVAVSLGAGQASAAFESRDIRDVWGELQSTAVPGVTRGQLAVSWQRSQPLLGGNYNDVIEIRISGAGESDGGD